MNLDHACAVTHPMADLIGNTTNHHRVTIGNSDEIRSTTRENRLMLDHGWTLAHRHFNIIVVENADDRHTFIGSGPARLTEIRCGEQGRKIRLEE